MLTEDEVSAIAYEQAYIEASELVGPNAPEFDSLCEEIAERIFFELMA